MNVQPGILLSGNWGSQILEEFPSIHGHIFVDIYKLLEISQSVGKRKNATNIGL